VARIQCAFERIRRERRPGLVTFITAGDPALESTAGIMRAIDEAGADVIELGVPFSDPLADGPVIQAASERALANGATLRRILSLVAYARPGIKVPIVLFTYANPVFRMGTTAFARAAADAGVDGVLMVDLPLEESTGFNRDLVDAGVDPICLISPTSTEARIAAASRASRGFLYAISRLGVTGARDEIAAGSDDLMARVRAATDLPVALGFGLSTPQHVRDACRRADAAVVGSALVSAIADAAAKGEDPSVAAGRYVSWLAGGI
jgi:tryptophan synthase alpha chain